MTGGQANAGRLIQRIFRNRRSIVITCAVNLVMCAVVRCHARRPTHAGLSLNELRGECRKKAAWALSWRFHRSDAII